MGFLLFARLVLGFFVGIAGVLFFPYLDRMLNPLSSTPGMITYLGVSLSIILSTAMILSVALQSKISPTKQFWVFAFVANVFIILTKFVFAPLSVYHVNQFSTISIRLNQSSTIFLIATILFFLYSIVTFVIYRGFMGRVQRLLQQKKVTKDTSRRKIASIFGIVLLVGIFTFLTGGVLLQVIFIPFTLGLDTFRYLQLILSSAYGLIVAVLLLFAVTFMTQAFKDSAMQAVIIRKAFIVSSLFTLCIALLLFYHILWAVFFLTLVSIWPLKIVIPK